MLTEILAALELIIKAVKGTRTEEKKRQKVAKQLLKIYLNIDTLVERGKNIVSFLKGGTNRNENDLKKLLQAQEKAIQAVISDFNDSAMLSLLKLHLPQFTDIAALFEVKGRQIGVFLSQIVKGGEPSMKDRQDIIKQLEQETDRWGDIYLLRHGRISPMNILAPRGDVILYATSKHVQEAEEVLSQIAQLGEELRLFLVDKFKLEDIL